MKIYFPNNFTKSNTIEINCSLLLRYVVSFFHTDLEIIVLEIFLKYKEKKEFNLFQIADILKLDTVQIGQALEELSSMGLLCQVMKKKVQDKNVNKTTFYLDFEITIWSLKCRMYLVLQRLKSRQLHKEFYICPNKNCPNSKRALESFELLGRTKQNSKLLNEMDRNFICDKCSSFYMIFTHKRFKRKHRIDLKRKFNSQLKSIQDLLNKCEILINEQAWSHAQKHLKLIRKIEETDKENDNQEKIPFTLHQKNNRKSNCSKYFKELQEEDRKLHEQRQMKLEFN